MSSPMPTFQRMMALREGGQVTRAHCMPHHGEYTVASHSWHAVNLLLALHPQPSLGLIKFLFYHDVSERWLGDLPYPTKRENPTLSAGYDSAEMAVNQVLEVCEPISQMEMDWVKSLDMLEFILWCYDQIALGNSVVHGPMETGHAIMRKRHDDGVLPAPVWQAFLAAQQNAPYRHSDFISTVIATGIAEKERLRERE